MQLGYCSLGAETGHEAGRKLLARMYEEKTGQKMPPIVTGERGKPYFEKDDCHFSLSHTPKMVFCVLADSPVGIDAECLDREIKLPLAEKILSHYEYAQYAKAADKRKALLTFWVLKEAAGKQTGEGINGYPNRTNFDVTDPRVQVIENHLVAIIE